MKRQKIYVINLKKRIDRKEYALKEFDGKPEFDLHIVEAHEGQTGSIGLWSTIKYIVGDLVRSDEEYVIICEDDHQFTEFYTKELLFKNIFKAQQNGVDVLLGGISWFNTALQISPELFWVDRFSGTQFTVIYRKFFNSILNADFKAEDTADLKMAALTDHKMIMYPFISVQKEFGYSDATNNNNENEGYVTQLFADVQEKLGQLRDVAVYYELKVIK